MVDEDINGRGRVQSWGVFRVEDGKDVRDCGKSLVQLDKAEQGKVGSCPTLQ